MLLNDSPINFNYLFITISYVKRLDYLVSISYKQFSISKNYHFLIHSEGVYICKFSSFLKKTCSNIFINRFNVVYKKMELSFFQVLCKVWNILFIQEKIVYLGLAIAFSYLCYLNGGLIQLPLDAVGWFILLLFFPFCNYIHHRYAVLNFKCKYFPSNFRKTSGVFLK